MRKKKLGRMEEIEKKNQKSEWKRISERQMMGAKMRQGREVNRSVFSPTIFLLAIYTTYLARKLFLACRCQDISKEYKTNQLGYNATPQYSRNSLYRT